MKSYEINLPETLDDQLHQRLQTAGFATVDEYVRHLIRQDVHLLDELELERAIDEGIASGFVPFTENFWNDLCAEARDTFLKNQRHA